MAIAGPPGIGSSTKGARASISSRQEPDPRARASLASAISEHPTVATSPCPPMAPMSATIAPIGIAARLAARAIGSSIVQRAPIVSLCQSDLVRNKGVPSGAIAPAEPSLRGVLVDPNESRGFPSPGHPGFGFLGGLRRNARRGRSCCPWPQGAKAGTRRALEREGCVELLDRFEDPPSLLRSSQLATGRAL